MSGPKVDTLEIERRRARELAAEREANTRLVSGAIVSIRSKVSAAKAACAGLGEKGDQLVKDLAELEGRLTAEVVASSGGYPSDLETARLFNAELAKTVSAVSAEADRAVGQVVDRANEYRRRAEVERRASKELAALEGFAQGLKSSARLTERTLDEAVVATLFQGAGEALQKGARKEATPRASVVAPAAKSAASPAKSAETLRDEALGMLAAIQRLVLSDAVDVTRKNRLSSVASDIRRQMLASPDDAPAAESLQSALTIGGYVVRDAQDRMELMESLYAECQAQRALIEGMGGQIAPLRGLWEYADENELDALLNELRRVQEQVATDAYIAHALDEVMSRHGYTVARSVCLSSAPDVAHRIFLAEGTDVGIHAFMGAGGVLMLETVAAGEQIRASEDGVEVRRVKATSAYDRARLLDSQVEFCSRHKELAAGLAEFGIVVGMASDMEPSEEHAVIFETTVSQASADEARGAQTRRRQSDRLAEREMR